MTILYASTFVFTPSRDKAKSKALQAERVRLSFKNYNDEIKPMTRDSGLMFKYYGQLDFRYDVDNSPVSFQTDYDIVEIGII